jgi:hypothetical protein
MRGIQRLEREPDKLDPLRAVSAAAIAIAIVRGKVDAQLRQEQVSMAGPGGQSSLSDPTQWFC